MHRNLPAIALAILIALPAAVPAAAAGFDTPGPTFSITFPSAPQGVVAGDTITVAATVTAHGPSSGAVQTAWAETVHLSASDDMGRALAIEPREATLTPTNPSVDILVRYGAMASGPHAVIVTAEGTTSEPVSNDTRFPVRRDTASVTVRSVSEPDAKWRVGLDVATALQRLADDAGELVLHARYAGDAGTFDWRTAPESHASPASTSLPFTLRFGAGVYHVNVSYEGAHAEGRSAGVRIVATDPAPSSTNGTVRAVIADAPTTVALTSSTVNDWKMKSPGSAFITRFTVGDGNGLDDVAALAVEYARQRADGSWRTIAVSDVDVAADLWAETGSDFEDSFSHAPLPVGHYRARVTATSRAADTVHVDRFFNISDASSTALGFDASPAHVGPALGGTVAGIISLADRNLGSTPMDADIPPGLGLVEFRVYRASTRMEWPVESRGTGTQPTSGAGTLLIDLRDHPAGNATYPYRQVDDAGVLDVDVSVAVPRGAAEGAYRISAYSRDTPEGSAKLIGTAPFDVGAIPAIATFTVETGNVLPGGNVTVNATLEPGDGIASVDLEVIRDGAVLAAARDFLPDGVDAPHSGTFTVTLPERVTRGPVTVRLLAFAREGGEPIVASGTAIVENAAPEVALSATISGSPVRGTVRIVPPGEVAFVAFSTDRNGDSVTLAAALVDWTGAPVAGANALLVPTTPPEPADGAARAWTLTMNESLDAGRYRVLVTATDDAGATSFAEMALDVGAWLEVALADPEVVIATVEDGFEGTTRIANTGNAAFTTLHVTIASADPLFATGTVTLQDAAGNVTSAALVGGRATLTRMAGLAGPGAEAVVTVTLAPAPGLDAGERIAPLVITAEGAA